MHLTEEIKKQLNEIFVQLLRSENFAGLIHYLSELDNNVNPAKYIIFDIKDFLNKNKNNIDFFHYKNTILMDFKEITEATDEFILKFNNSLLVIPKPCVLLKSEFNDIYTIFDEENNILCKFILKEQA